MSIILPDVSQGLNEHIIQKFTFFNMCRFFEIEGEHFIDGLDKKRSTENGLLIKLWFPQCEIMIVLI